MRAFIQYQLNLSNLVSYLILYSFFSEEPEYVKKCLPSINNASLRPIFEKLNIDTSFFGKTAVENTCQKAPNVGVAVIDIALSFFSTHPNDH